MLSRFPHLAFLVDCRCTTLTKEASPYPSPYRNITYLPYKPQIPWPQGDQHVEAEPAELTRVALRVEYGKTRAAVTHLPVMANSKTLPSHPPGTAKAPTTPEVTVMRQNRASQNTATLHQATQEPLVLAQLHRTLRDRTRGSTSQQVPKPVEPHPHHPQRDRSTLLQ